ncbi:unnamed protein product, partial [Scytosiphon promiscuus]
MRIACRSREIRAVMRVIYGVHLSCCGPINLLPTAVYDPIWPYQTDGCLVAAYSADNRDSLAPVLILRPFVALLCPHTSYAYLGSKMPMYCLIVFGCYALAKIGLGLIAFKDCSA